MFSALSVFKQTIYATDADASEVDRGTWLPRKKHYTEHQPRPPLINFYLTEVMQRTVTALGGQPQLALSSVN